MAGVSFNLLGASAMFLFAIWLIGRLFKACQMPAILGYVMAGILLGPNCLDLVPYSSDGYCSGVIFKNVQPPDSSSSTSAERRLDSASSDDHDCLAIFVFNSEHIQDIWSFAGTIGVTLLIMESGMHINFDKVRQIGAKALVVAVLGTALPMVVGMALVAGFFPAAHFYNGFSAGCALAPTSVGISINLLSEAKMLNSMAGQTTLTAAFIDDVFSLVLLVLLSSLASGSADPGLIVLRTIAAFAFLGLGAVLAQRVFPRLEVLLERIPLKSAASIQPRDEAHLSIMVAALVFFSYIGSHIGSHLLGAFVAGMCFVEVPRSHTVWVDQFKRVIRWLVRVFFAATVGFAVPLEKMMQVDAISRGLAFGAVPGVLCKVLAGLAARAHSTPRERRLMTEASCATRGGVVQPIQYLVGMAMVARGEFAFLVAYSATKMTNPEVAGERMLEDDVYAAVTWGLVWALILAPLLFKWALGVYMRAAPVQRGMSIGADRAGANFLIKVFGAHHAGMLREMLNAIHAEGLDVLEASAETDGAVDCDQFTVQSRGKQKDFDDEKLEDIRHHIQEVVGDKNVVVEFEAAELLDDAPLVAVEVQVIAEKSAATFATATARLEALQLDLLEASKQHTLQVEHGHEKTLDHNLFYVVPGAQSGDAASPKRSPVPIERRVAGVVKEQMSGMLGELGLKGEVLAKAVTSRSHGFSELKDFDPARAMERATGVVWMVLVLGPHEVRRLGAACRALTPADEAGGLRVLHVAHSHPLIVAERPERACTRLFVEQPAKVTLSASEVEETRDAVSAALCRVYELEGDGARAKHATAHSPPPPPPSARARLRVVPLLDRDALAREQIALDLQDLGVSSLLQSFRVRDRSRLGSSATCKAFFSAVTSPTTHAASTVSFAAVDGSGGSPGAPRRGSHRAEPPLSSRRSSRRSTLGIELGDPDAEPHSRSPYRVAPSVDELHEKVRRLEAELRRCRQADADNAVSSLGLPLNERGAPPALSIDAVVANGQEAEMTIVSAR